MPVDYECSCCLLGFSLGLYHYHIHTHGYFGRKLVVCSECGLQHSIEIPLSNCHGEYLLESMPCLLMNSTRITRGGTKKLLVPHADWTRRTVVSSDQLSDIPCQSCGARSLLIQWPRQGAPCPNCSALIPNEPFCTWFT
jgi:hypothetical protein